MTAGGIAAAILLGVTIAFMMYRPIDEPPPPPPPKIELNTPYDDSWGKLATADADWRVTHILVSWTGSGVTPKQPRSKEDARKLIDEIWARFHNSPSEANWKALQVEFNEDTGPVHNVYKSGDSLVEPFKQTAKFTRRGFARIAESNYGFHLIRRE